MIVVLLVKVRNHVQHPCVMQCDFLFELVCREIAILAGGGREEGAEGGELRGEEGGDIFGSGSRSGHGCWLVGWGAVGLD